MRLEVVTVVKQCLLGKRAWDSAVRLDVTLVELCLLWKRAWDAAVTLDVFVLGLLAGLVRHLDLLSENFNLSLHQT